ncbi:hypothetical protein CH249_06985 [Rhodococcus sp. 05-2255-3B1]|uniref:PASTA domain-containing protein n=1 Tax=unclassified Rhodococcus (in: high G+C Gram-positive bacteria) TaxID=192944 RepID=UPI000B9A9C72|nr:MULTISPECIES: PASTA domain-containing protein [unclassified Rhodococcus (in: high G+C Gram-positive bacteria)]OZE11011.1 hypothetical protein CH250_11040 [Rhodococcus sp. 05-2255-3C]OZE14168.1 hypothetical protein CH249_06985 [Rhodococcus sp. 05-2255-3B1]OZE24739.1 hypothetical protein CH255_00860 [Rhodococcus sp. 05-2255-2A2]
MIDLIAQETSVTTLSWNQTLIAVGVAAASVLLVGVIVAVARGNLPSQEPGASLARSWIAITLVLGLIMFCAFSLAVNDAGMRSTLVGGLTASAGAAVAFYFSSQSSDQGRRDILDAAFGTDTVPELSGKEQTEAAQLAGMTSLQLVIDPSSTNADTGKVTKQTPVAGSKVRRGSSVVVTLT